MDWISSLLKLRCSFCGTSPSADQQACDICAWHLAETELSNAVVTRVGELPVVSVGNYEGWLQSLILSNKQGPATPVVRELARLLSQKTPPDWRKLPIVWIPGSQYGEVHLVERLAFELKQHGQKLSSVPLLKRRISRLKTPQKLLDETQRRGRVIEKLYRVRKQLRVSTRQTMGQEVLLLDDVVTTGSTLLGCKKLLEERLGLKVQGALSIAYTVKKNAF